MGLFNVLALSVETSVVAWYLLVPLVSPGGAPLLREDLRYALNFRQSLALQALLSLSRLLFFVYIRRRNKRVPSTRCFVFVVSLIEVCACCLGSLQPLLYLDGEQVKTFDKFRHVSWGAFYVIVLGSLGVFSTLLQLGYILQLNKSRGRLADDKLLLDVLQSGDTPRARWRSKWATLGKQLAGRRKPKDPTFEAMVRLYAHQEGAVDRLALASDRDAAEFEFYLPQLCSFLLLGGFAKSPQLCSMLLRKCSVSHVFAHKMLWYLRSYCLQNPVFSTDADVQRVQMLIEDVTERGAAPALAIACPPSPANLDQQPQQFRTDRVSASAQEVEALLPSSQEDHYATFQDNDDLEKGKTAPVITIKVPPAHGVEPFELETAFLGSLANVSSNLRAVAYNRRNEMTAAASPVVNLDVDDVESASSVSGAWSPKSDTVQSPQSDGSTCSPQRLARYDSTDRFLQDLSERDSKLEEEDEEGESSDPSSETRNQAATSEPPCVIFKERWADKERRIQATSPYGQLPGWRLLPVIVKSDDDLRQEQLALQLIRQFANVFEEFKVPVFVRPYDVIAISATSGLVEAISDTISIDSLKRNDGEFTTLLDFFTRHFGDPSTQEFRRARANFVSSMAGYAIICYLLQIKDRHNGNILLDAEGHIIHIDFGFILSNNPGNMAFEQAPFKLTADFVELMGGPRSAHFRRFRSLCVRAFLVARKYRHRFVLLVEMMLHGNEHLPCFAGDPKGTVERLAARFQPDLDINSCEDFVHELIDASLDNWRTLWYDKYQRWIVGVF
ncbi:Phosphatidylinositol 4-kinase beta [Phytophthora boehmeriae]|uniref:1-phosphatidylinositol 4-kinase n=1 Tax=Phytophthora boehmeriae TaxID=109152 RepID=A0A8T1WN44_9STRA|nr:Phosphatidylinositol 4-kinase beta [Phytophthora boehmeriae]